MNHQEFFEKLVTALHDFGVHPSFGAELIGFMKKSGNEADFLSVLRTRLMFLAEYGIQATIHKEFEPLERGIYSMHVSGRDFNIRILYGFYDGNPKLLLAFHEKAGHSRTDYSGKVNIAVKRLSEFKGEQ